MRGLRGALAVRVNDGSTDRIVTRYCRGLKFTKTAPGGHRDMAFTMVLPKDTFTELGPADRAYLSDARTARTVFDGYLERPTPVDGPDGQEYAVRAMGGMALTNDETRALVYLTRDLGVFEKASDSMTGGNIDTADWVANPAFKRVRTHVELGTVAGTGVYVSAGNYIFERANMNLGGVRVGAIQSAANDATWNTDFVTTTGIVATGVMTTPGGTLEIYVGATNFPNGTRRFAFRTRRTGGATTVPGDAVWTDWADFSAIGQRMDRNGTLLSGSGGLVSTVQVLASQVVEDLLGRLLTFCDPATAQVDATTFGITELAYPDGVKAANVLDDLTMFHPEMVWEVLETLANGKHRFNFRAWPTTARYEVSVKDGWRQIGSDADLCNRILVSWTDIAGQSQVTEVTAASLGLVGIGLPVDDLGSRVKDADPITLPPGKGSAANATRIGGQILAEKINPPRAGSVVVRRPIIDRLTGNTVMPWELEPGYLCRVREIGEDLRITQVDYDDDTCSAALALGTPVLTTEQRLAQLDRATPTVAVGA